MMVTVGSTKTRRRSALLPLHEMLHRNYYNGDDEDNDEDDAAAAVNQTYDYHHQVEEICKMIQYHSDDMIIETKIIPSGGDGDGDGGKCCFKKRRRRTNLLSTSTSVVVSSLSLLLFMIIILILCDVTSSFDTYTSSSSWSYYSHLRTSSSSLRRQQQTSFRFHHVVTTKTSICMSVSTMIASRRIRLRTTTPICHQNIIAIRWSMLELSAVKNDDFVIVDDDQQQQQQQQQQEKTDTDNDDAVVVLSSTTKSSRSRKKTKTKKKNQKKEKSTTKSTISSSSSSSALVLYKNNNNNNKKTNNGVQKHDDGDTNSNNNNMPPWLIPNPVLTATGAGVRAGTGTTSIENNDGSSKDIEIQIQIQLLEYSLLEHGFTVHDAADIIRGILLLSSSNSDNNQSDSDMKILGCIEFCKLIVKLEKDQDDNDNKKKNGEQEEEQQHQQSPSLLQQQPPPPDDNNNNNEFSLFVTKDVLLASIYHFMECYNARQNGIYDKVRQSVRRSIGTTATTTTTTTTTTTMSETSTTSTDSDTNTFSSTSTNHAYDDSDYDENDEFDENDEIDTSQFVEFGTKFVKRRRRRGKRNEYFDDDDDYDDDAVSGSSLQGSLVLSPLSSSFNKQHQNHRQNSRFLKRLYDENEGDSSIRELFTDDVIRLAQSASRIKRAEILADVMLTSGRPLSKADYAKLREMLLSLTEDWRALAIRCVASLFRLERTIQNQRQFERQFHPTNNFYYYNGPSHQHFFTARSPDTIRAARGTMRIYANLAQRLGMHRLKSELESRAFMMLYPKQYAAVSILFQQDGDSMRAVSAYLTSQIKDLISRDTSLLSQLDTIDVTSRVKEPYSFWKKLLRKRLARRKANNMQQKSLLSSASSELSTTDVLDSIALRVVFKASKLTIDETDSETRARERIICYYIQDLIGSLFPVRDKSRIKDYVRNPKPNGYQSLHFTSAITFNGQEYPFEVQIRSVEMHRAAEFGDAAHWDYKLALPPSQTTDPGDHLLSPAKSDVDTDTTANSEKQSTQVAEVVGEMAYIDALVTARQSLVRSNVYVFLAGSSFEEGKLLSLPAKSQVCDLVLELERQEGVRIDQDDLTVMKNGKISFFDDDLRNGDVVLLFRSGDSLPATKST